MISHKPDIEQLFQAAVQHHQAGRLLEADDNYRKILHIAPNHVYAMNLRGVIAKQVGRYDLAESLFHQAIQVKPDFEDAYNNLGNTFIKLENLDEAAACFRQALAINPKQPVIHNNLGNVLNKQGHTAEAVACYEKALTLDPHYANAYNNLGKLLKLQGNLEQAAAYYHKALSINPRLVEAHNNLGNVFNEQGRLTDAIACYRKALDLKPDYARACNNLGRVLKDQGKLQEAVAVFQKALAFEPDLAGAHSNLLFTLNYLPECSQEEIYRESLRWGKQHADSVHKGDVFYDNAVEKDRCLKIGYVSPDFRTHSVAYFIEPVIKNHDSGKVETFCYANVIRSDEITERLRRTADHWFSIVGKNDAEVVAQIKKDKIDILVDLTGHTGGNRLLVFAHRAAPVQVSWLGYPNTTGMQAVDYRITDAIADPVGIADKLHTEELMRLDHGFLCFQADESTPEVGRLPCLDQGYITFGNFNDLAKTTPQVIKIWSEILRAVPDARILLKAKQLTDSETKARYLEMFRRQGISSGRISFFGRLPGKEDHLAFYNRIDICLDPFPYNGTTTTCEALWMGVPVVTLLGNRHSGRVGASIMHRIGRAELVAESTEEYIKIAGSLAEDHGRLQEFREGLREQMRFSQLMDKQVFTHTLENAYRRMWYKWCENR